MLRTICTSLLLLGTLLGTSNVTAQVNTRDQIRAIEQEYARQSGGRRISDQQLEYYLDRSNSGWTMNQISRDMEQSRRTYANSQWQPQAGWSAREVVCTSINNKYRECAVPFRGQAVITQQISNSACVEGQSWGNKPGAVWVNRGCRARFGIVRTGNGQGQGNNNRTIVCQSNQGQRRECATGFRGRVQLVNRLNNSASCVEGRSWGQREGTVWVTAGCRARFQSIGRPGRGDDNAWNSAYAVTCSSTDNRQNRCAWDQRYGTPQLDRQYSNSNCVAGRTWGYTNGGDIWVNGGCRARFTSNRTGFNDRNGRYNGNDGYSGNDRNDRYNGNGRDDWNRDANYAVTCASEDNRTARCTWDDRYGTPRLDSRQSNAACIEGRSWGYDNSRDSLWVSQGCRARFVSR